MCMRAIEKCSDVHRRPLDYAQNRKMYVNQVRRWLGRNGRVDSGVLGPPNVSAADRIHLRSPRPCPKMVVGYRGIPFHGAVRAVGVTGRSSTELSAAELCPGRGKLVANASTHTASAPARPPPSSVAPLGPCYYYYYCFYGQRAAFLRFEWLIVLFFSSNFDDSLLDLSLNVLFFTSSNFHFAVYIRNIHCLKNTHR